MRAMFGCLAVYVKEMAHSDEESLTSRLLAAGRLRLVGSDSRLTVGDADVGRY